MNKSISTDVIAEIRRLYATNKDAKALFDLLATRQKDSSETAIHRLSYLLETDHASVVALVRLLHSARCGDFIVGRKGHPSRFRWRYGLRSLGEAAAGAAQELQRIKVDPADQIDDALEPSPSSTAPKLTIPEAKKQLAESLGVPQEAIEITVRH